MLYRLIELFSEQNDPAKLRAAIHKLSAENERLRLENANLRAEGRQLRRRLRDPELRIVRRAERDALLIGGLHFAGLPTSRRACYAIGITEWRWTRAQALLRVARITDHGNIRTETPEDYERAIRVAVERLTRDGLDSLRYRMPLSRQ